MGAFYRESALGRRRLTQLPDRLPERVAGELGAVELGGGNLPEEAHDVLDVELLRVVEGHPEDHRRDAGRARLQAGAADVLEARAADHAAVHVEIQAQHVAALSLVRRLDREHRELPEVPVLGDELDRLVGVTEFPEKLAPVVVHVRPRRRPKPSRDKVSLAGPRVHGSTQFPRSCPLSRSPLASEASSVIVCPTR